MRRLGGIRVACVQAVMNGLKRPLREEEAGMNLEDCAVDGQEDCYDVSWGIGLRDEETWEVAGSWSDKVLDRRLKRLDGRALLPSLEHGLLRGLDSLE